MCDVSDSSMYGLPYHSPSIRSRGSVITYVSFVPSPSSTLSVACPICFTARTASATRARRSARPTHR